jgi:MmyB-like transcription regulator ligand binding domain
MRFSASGQLFEPFRIPVTLHRDLRHRALDLAQIVRSQLEGCRSDVLVEAVQLRRPRDRHDPRLLREEPGDRDLRGRRLLSSRDLGEEVDEGLVRLSRLRREAGNDVAEVGAVERRVLGDPPRATDFYADWEQVATDAVAILRSEAGRDPYDRGLSDLVGELSTQSETFRTRWAAHNVRFHDTGVKRFHHPVVGDLALTFETMQLSADEGLTMFVYTAEVGSNSEEALNLLASWTATLDPAEAAT